MPSYSIGFCVAMTMNGRASSYVVPSIVTWFSCIALEERSLRLRRRAVDLVDEQQLAKIGPGRNSNCSSAG